MNVTSIHAFAEKVALITDGTNAVGRAVCMQLALNGAYVIVGLPEPNPEGHGLIEDLSALGTHVNTCVWDPFALDGPKALIDQAVSFFGRLDLLINCLKIDAPSNLKNGDIDRQIIEGSLTSTLSVITEAIPYLEQRPRPRILNVISNALIGDLAQTAGNYGIVGLTKTLPAKLPPKFRVNAVNVLSRATTAGSLDPAPVREDGIAAPDDVARTVLFLLSGEAVAINGQLIEII